MKLPTLLRPRRDRTRTISDIRRTARIEARIKQYPHRRPEMAGIPPSRHNTLTTGRYWQWELAIVNDGYLAVYRRPGCSTQYAVLYLGDNPTPTLSKYDLELLQDNADSAYDLYRLENGLPL